MVFECLGEIDVDASRVGRRSDKANTLRIRLRCETAGSLEQVCQTIVLRPEGIISRESYLSTDCDGALQLEVGLPEDQNIVVRLERHIRRGPRRGEGNPGWTDVAPSGITFEQIRRIERHSHLGGELAVR